MTISLGTSKEPLRYYQDLGDKSGSEENMSQQIDHLPDLKLNNPWSSSSSPSM